MIGWDRLAEGRVGYAHATFLANLGVARGRSVLVPLRLGVGVAVDNLGDEVDVAVGAAHQSSRCKLAATPIKLYGELALKLTLLDGGAADNQIDGDGGLGLRLYF